MILKELFFGAIIVAGFAFIGIIVIDRSYEQDIKNCKEESKLISPTIVYANDSSFKILKYNHENLERKIRIQKSDSLYNLNDSNYLIEPCEQIILKRSR